jgi:3-oxoacyl-(acyl-carrier-protein) synthase
MSHPAGAGLQRAMGRALDDAGVRPKDIDYVNAHGTSTPVGDRAEAIALKSLFNAAGAQPAISSTKGLTGHPLSLAGAMEAAFCALAIKEGFTPGNPHLVTPDEACAELLLPRETLARGPAVVLNNSSGFGGSNVCHVLRAV